jgi:methyl-accepting chemotaxis protein
MNLSIGKKMGLNTLLFSIVALIPLIILGVMAVRTAHESFIQNKFDQLVSIREIKKTQIEDFFKEREGDMGVLVEMVNTLRREAFAKLEAVQMIRKNQIEGYFKDRLEDISALSKNRDILNMYDTLVQYHIVVCVILMSIFIVRNLSKTLLRVIEGLSSSTEQVASAAGQVSTSSQSLAEGASEQAASIEETSSSMEEMSSMTRKNAENAAQADRLMGEANQIVITANTSMGQLTQSMEDISKAGEETSKIIKAIDEISFQTNLLALNAAVEAARAGEAGAGFAVVADEVRNLAITEMDKVVQQNAANAEESASASEEMNAQAEQLKEYVGDLVMLVTGKKT